MYIKALFDNARLKGVLKLLLLLLSIHCVCFYGNLRMPFGLLYGPLLLSIIRKMEAAKFWLHTFPFFLFSGFYLVFRINPETIGIWQAYYSVYLSLLTVSLVSYAWTVSAILKSPNNKISDVEKEFVQFLAYGCGFAALLVALLAVRSGFDIPDVGFDPAATLFFMLGIFIALILIFLMFYGKNENEKTNKNRNRLPVSGLDELTSLAYMETLGKCVRETEIYRNPDISLEMLSTETTIPKHHLSQLLNGYLGKNFYQYIAELRIQYALIRLKNDSGIKIESLAYDCGFNSKTSFNRYFKEYTGCLPSYYKTKMEHC